MRTLFFLVVVTMLAAGCRDPDDRIPPRTFDAGPGGGFDAGPTPSRDAGPGPGRDAGPLPVFDAGPPGRDAGGRDAGRRDAGPPPPGGACDNPADRTQIGRTFGGRSVEGVAFNCAISCGTDVACNTRCMMSDAMLSGPCAGCFAQQVACAVNNCALSCGSSPSGMMCTRCRCGLNLSGTDCIAEFERCAGPVSPTRCP